MKGLVGNMECLSYDLSSATAGLILRHFSLYSIGLFHQVSLMATNIFLVPFVKRRWSHVSFVAGQPLGYYSSWPLFAFTHHLVVWWSADQVYPGKVFSKYVVLGDDVVIADKGVALVYASVLEKLGVSISKFKSLISDTGYIEFAKRFLVNGLRKDLSPISVRCLSHYYHPYGLHAIRLKYTVQRFSTFCRIGGLGYKSLGRITHKQSLWTKRRYCLWTRPLYPLEWWLGRGAPLNPYLRDSLIHFCF